MGSRLRRLAAGILLFSAGSAGAQQPATTGPANPLGSGSVLQTQSETTYSDGPLSAHLLGDAWGIRQTLHDKGIDLRANMINEFAGNVAGGQYRAIRSANEFNFGSDLDLGKLGSDQGGAVHVTFSQRWGRSLSIDALKNLVSVQEIYGTGEDFRLSELSFEQAFANNHINISLGRIITENDFASSPLLWDHAAIYCIFQNNGVCGTPVGVPVNSGYTAYPQSTWGGRVRIAPIETVYVQTGVYEVNPSLAAAKNGLKISSSGATGAYIPLEVAWKPGHDILGAPNMSGQLPGDYRLGAYYDTSQVSDPFSNIPGQQLPATAGQLHNGRSGFYATAAQMVWRVPTAKPNGTRSLSIFGAVNVGDRATALYRVYAELGLVLKGTFDGRDDDTISFAVTDTEVNPRRRAEEARLLAAGFDVFDEQVREIALELNYSAAVYQGIAIEPGMQLILNPGGIRANATAVVLDLRTSIKF